MAQIPNLQSTNTLGVDDQAILRQGTIDKRIGLNLAGILSWAKRNGYTHLGEHTTGIQFPDTESFTTFQGKVYFVNEGVTLPYSATSNDPSTDTNLLSKVDVNTNNIINPNLIRNSSFDVAGSVETPPDATSRSYNAGDELFSGIFASVNLSNVTYVDGKLNGTGHLYVDVYKTEKQKLSTSTYITSIASREGNPVEAGASFVDNGNYWRVTFDMVDTFSVKLEQGSIATKHGTGEGVADKASDLNSPYVITTKKNDLQRAVDEAVKRKYDDYKQINNASNSGSVVIDLGGGVAKIDRPIELPSGAGGYTFANGIIAPDTSNFPNGENLIEYVGNG